jgi:hypothetical protein
VRVAVACDMDISSIVAARVGVGDVYGRPFEGTSEQEWSRCSRDI